MKLEQQVVSLELAQKLKDLGVKQEGEFRWRFTNDFSIKKGFKFEKEVQLKPVNPHDTHFGVYSYISAFTVAELGEMLPKEITVSGGTFAQLNCRRDGNGYWYISYREQATMRMIADIGADTEADARAKMFVYLLENNLIIE